MASAEQKREQFINRSLPSNEEAERTILGAILLDNELIAEATEHLSPENFYSPFHRNVFRAMISLFEKQRPIDPILISEEFKAAGELESIGGTVTITNLSFGLPHFATIAEYITLVLEKSLLRSLIRECSAITDKALAEEDEVELVLDKAEKAIFELAEARTKRSFAHIKPVADRVYDLVRDRAAGESTGITGLTTGYSEIDNYTSGLQRTDLVIVAGRPSMGKTALCLNIAQNAALRADAVVAIFSLEMSKEQLVTRMLSSQAHINAHRFRTGHLMSNEWEKLAGAVTTLSNAKIFIDDTPGISALEIRAKARRLAAEQKSLDLIVVDYLQLMGGGTRRNENRQQEVSQISRELKSLAKELDVPVLALSQLSRAPEARNPPKPLMSDLRESGSIEQDADVVAFIYREDYYKETDENKGLAELIIAKQRNGPTGTVRLAFLREFTRFENYFEG